MTHQEKAIEAIKILQELEPPEGYYLAFSGGKDSIVIKKLADMAGVQYSAHYSNTTIDPPELIKYIRKYHPEVIWENPRKALVHQIKISGYPTRQARWCCKDYKERGGEGRLVITGIRAEESLKRAGRRFIENCYRRTGKRYLNIILNWSQWDVWNFIREHHLPYCDLYNQGWERVGCLFCPMNTKRMEHVFKYPGYVKLFIKAFERRYEYAKERGLTSAERFRSGEEMFWFWIKDAEYQEDPDQLILFE